jgi:hypothetical protein
MVTSSAEDVRVRFISVFDAVQKYSDNKNRGSYVRGLAAIQPLQATRVTAVRI